MMMHIAVYSWVLLERCRNFSRHHHQPLLYLPSLHNKEKRKWQAYDGGRVLISFSLRSSPLAYKYHKYTLRAGKRTQFVLLLLKIRITTILLSTMQPITYLNATVYYKSVVVALKSQVTIGQPWLQKFTDPKQQTKFKIFPPKSRAFFKT